MPIYEYQCVKCAHLFDAIQKISDDPLTVCPECGDKLKKCVSGPAIQFKGSGFYITDYTNKGKKDKGGKADKASKKGD